MNEIGRNSPCHCGSGKKYKKCCLFKDEKKAAVKRRVVRFSRRDLISGPYKKCPSPKCCAKDSFGVFTPVGSQKDYIRECIKCGYSQKFIFPPIKKKVVYLDQFIISNLIKLLDKSHPSHATIKSDPFWEKIFIKLEAAAKSQAIVCPDSFYHKDESLVGNIDFRLAQRLYEHFSHGKTLYPSTMIERNQITQHFEGWLENRKVEFDFNPENIAFERDLHSWDVGIAISVRSKPYPGEIDNLKVSNSETKKQLKEIWTRWQIEQDVSFVNRVREETAGLWQGITIATQRFFQRRALAMEKISAGEAYDMKLEDFMPPTSNDILEDVMRVAQSKNVPQQEIGQTILKYFNDIDALLEMPYMRISSVMFAGWARRAALGKKEPPKSTTDIQFIASYLPYCDALFVDKESAQLLKELPKETPSHLRLGEFNAKVFSLKNKNEFLDYLDQIVLELSPEQIFTLKDVNGENYARPYWGIIEQEKKELNI